MTKYAASVTQEWLRDNSVNVLEWPSQSPELNAIEPLWRDLKMAVHLRSSSNLTELERICKEDWQKIPQSRCAKLVASYPKILKAVSAAKCASTKHWVKGLTYVNEREWALLARFVYTYEEFVIVTEAPKYNRMTATGQDTDDKRII